MKKFLITITTLNIFFLTIFPVHAITNPVLDPNFGSGAGTIGESSPLIIARFLARFFTAALAAGTIFFLVYFVVGAFKWITAGGDAKQVSDARSAITQSIIGLAVLASVFAIANLISPLLGLTGTSGNCNFPRQICWPTL